MKYCVIIPIAPTVKDSNSNVIDYLFLLLFFSSLFYLCELLGHLWSPHLFLFILQKYVYLYILILRLLK